MMVWWQESMKRIWGKGYIIAAIITFLWCFWRMVAATEYTNYTAGFSAYAYHWITRVMVAAMVAGCILGATK